MAVSYERGTHVDIEEMLPIPFKRVHCSLLISQKRWLSSCSHVTAFEPVDCLRANNRTQLTAARARAFLVKERSVRAQEPALGRGEGNLFGALLLCMINSGFSGSGAARAEDAQGTPTQSHISPSILVYEDKN